MTQSRPEYVIRACSVFSVFTVTACLYNPAGIYLFKVKNRNSGTICEIFSKLTIKTPKRRLLWTDFTHWSGVFVIDFEQINAVWESGYGKMQSEKFHKCRVTMIMVNKDNSVFIINFGQISYIFLVLLLLPLNK